MKVSCEIIKDLVPLYLEDMLSEESKKLVEENLEFCPEEKAYVQQALDKKETKQIKEDLSKEINQKPIKTIKRNIFALILKLLVLAVSISSLFFIFINLNKEELTKASFEQANISAKKDGDKLILTFDNRAYSIRYEAGNFLETTIMSQGKPIEYTKGQVTHHQDEYFMILSSSWNPTSQKKMQTIDIMPILTDSGFRKEKDKLVGVYYQDYIKEKLIKIYGEKNLEEYEGENRSFEHYTFSKLKKYKSYLPYLLVASAFAFIVFRKFKLVKLLTLSIFLYSFSILIIDKLLKAFKVYYYSVFSYDKNFLSIMVFAIPLFLSLLMIVLLIKDFIKTKK